MIEALDFLLLGRFKSVRATRSRLLIRPLLNDKEAFFLLNSARSEMAGWNARSAKQIAAENGKRDEKYFNIAASTLRLISSALTHYAPGSWLGDCVLQLIYSPAL
jgi:hypothetical protein